MAKSGIEYDASLLALAKPTESALTAAGKALQNGADFYWQNKLNTLKSKLGEEELTAAQLKNDFDKENNPLTLEANKELLKQSQIKTDADTINLDTLKKTQEASISKANSDAKLALIDVMYKPKHYEAQINQNNASAANAYASAAHTRTQTGILNDEHAANLNFGGVINARAKGDLNAINEEYSKAFEALQQAKNDANLSEEQKKELAKKEQLLNLAYTNSIKNATSSINAEARAAKAGSASLGDLGLKLKNLDSQQSQQVNYISSTAMGLEDIDKFARAIDPNFGYTGKISAWAWEKALGSEARSTLEAQISQLAQRVKTAKNSKLLKSDLEMLDKIVKTPYGLLDNEATFRRFMHIAAQSARLEAAGLKDSTRLSGRGNPIEINNYVNEAFNVLGRYQYNFDTPNANTKTSSYNATNSGQNTGTNQPFVHNARAKPNDLSNFDNGVNVK